LLKKLALCIRCLTVSKVLKTTLNKTGEYEEKDITF